jgi:hypothetical protein
MDDGKVVPFQPRRDPGERSVVTVGGPVDSTTVGLRVHGDDLVPDEVTRLLGVAPTKAWRLGERWNPRLPPAGTGAWFLDEGWAPEEPEALTRRLLDRLPADPACWAELRSRFRVSVCYGISLEAWNRGFDLSGATIGRLAVLGVEVGFDIYGAGDPPFEFPPPTA